MAAIYLLLFFVLPVAAVLYFVITKRKNSPIFSNQPQPQEPEYVIPWLSYCIKNGIVLNKPRLGPLLSWQVRMLPKGLTPIVRTRRRTPKQRYKNLQNLG